MQDNRVVIAGAGPVGCCAALSLAQAGIPVLVLEAGDELLLDLRASTFHPPTLDMLEELGVVDTLIGQGLICPRWQYRDTEAGVIADWDLGMLSDYTNHPYRVQAEQFRLTDIIYNVLKDMPDVEVRFGARVTGTSQDADTVTIEIETADGPETVTGTYLIAADGGSSAVRKSQNIGFDGLTFPEKWLIASTPYDFSQRFEGLAPIAYVTSPAEWFVFVYVSGLWRVLLPARQDETDETILNDEYMQSRLQQIAEIDGEYDIQHRTAYSVHQRVAENYVKGRIFLAGDAAHINNPLGGMGMNGGIHDAINLCEKLIQVWRGEADESAFDRYDRQRRPIAIEYVQKATINNKQMLEEADPAVRKKRQDELRRTAENPETAKAFLLQSSMISALQRANAVE